MQMPRPRTPWRALRQHGILQHRVDPWAPGFAAPARTVTDWIVGACQRSAGEGPPAVSVVNRSWKHLRQAFQRETELFFESIMREDRNVLDFMTADYTFVNERLARHYEIPNI